MKNLTIVALSLLLVSSVLFMAFKPSPTPAQANDHVALILKFDNSRVFISENGTNFEEMKIDRKTVNGIYDMNALISVTKKYESQGYKLVSVHNQNQNGSTDNVMIWMTKSN